MHKTKVGTFNHFVVPSAHPPPHTVYVSPFCVLSVNFTSQRFRMNINYMLNKSSLNFSTFNSQEKEKKKYYLFAATSVCAFLYSHRVCALYETEDMNAFCIVSFTKQKIIITKTLSIDFRRSHFLPGILGSGWFGFKSLFYQQPVIS